MRKLLLLVVVLLPLFAWQQVLAAAKTPVPQSLDEWQAWVLADNPDHDCPFVASGQKDGTRACLWWQPLHLEADGQGAVFLADLEVFGRSVVVLPGEAANWPQDVTVNGKPTGVGEQAGRPVLSLEKGHYQLRGKFSWPVMPRTLLMPTEAGLIFLTVNESNITSPVRDASGRLWLQQQARQSEANERDSVSVRVFRKLVDGNPLELETRLQLNVSGREREQTMGPLLLPGFVIQSFSSPLPARIEKNGALRVQLSPGRHEILMLSHSTQPLVQITFDSSGEPWPDQEIWAYEARRELRTAQVDGVPAIDASQTQLPVTWQNLPAFLLENHSTLTLKEIHRGDPNPADSDLQLNKKMWLDFSGDGFTVEDAISGTMRRDWRLETVDAYQLGSASVDGAPQLITRLGENQGPGIEIRQAEMNVRAVSRLAAGGSLPVSGWRNEFDNVSLELELPPAWSVLHASGPDYTRGSWVSRWDLWDIFILLVITVSLGRAVSWSAGALGFFTLLVIYQRSGAPVWLWLNLAAVFALLPFVGGRFKNWVNAYVFVSVAATALTVFFFAVDQARYALYPQLEQRFETSYFTSNTMTVSDELSLNRPEQAEAELMLQEAPMRTRSIAKLRQEGIGGLDSYSKPESYASYDVGQKIQVGPGMPEWSWKQVTMSWSGPVVAGENMRLFLVSPVLNRLGFALAVLLPVGLLVLLLLKLRGRKTWPDIRGLASAVPMAGVALLMSLPSPPVDAAEFPPAELLQELERRLLQPPECVPECTAIESVVVAANEKSLTVEMLAHSRASMALPLPVGLEQWLPSQVTVDDKPGQLVALNGRFYLLLSEGRHRVLLKGVVPDKDSLSLDFQQTLHNVSFTAEGWSVSGLPGPRQRSESLQLTRVAKATSDAAVRKLLPDPVYPFVLVERQINLALEWSVVTHVIRVAPAQGPINLKIPLLAGERPVSGQVTETGEGLAAMDVRLGAEQSVYSWQSALPVTDTLQLLASQSVPWVETWRLQASDMWHVRSTGIPPLMSSAPGYLPSWKPWPGENVDILIQRPAPVSGEQLVLDRAGLEVNPGRRASDYQLNLTARATQGGQYPLQLPENAELTGVFINGRQTPISYTDNRLSLPIVPGEQQLEVRWQMSEGIPAVLTTPALDLGIPAANIHIITELPRDRWILAVRGPQMGPAVLFWSLLLVVFVFMSIIGRTGLTPVKTWQWLLLSLGIATVNLFMLVVLVVWFATIELRGRLKSAFAPAWMNAMQLSLFALSLVVIIAILSYIPISLLSVPDMYITGNQSHGNQLVWFQDQISGVVPEAMIVSVPVWVYRAAMLAWSLWLALASLAWIKWAWGRLGHLGYWFALPARKPAMKPEDKESKGDSDANA